MPDLLVLDNISKRYSQGPYIIQGMSHQFKPSTATALVGPNGSGKTTLLRLLSALSFPTSGRISFNGRDIAEHPYQYLDHVAFVHDMPDVPEYLSAVELMEYVLRARGRWNEEALERTASLLDELMLDERRENLIGTYSSGMLRKTQIGLALALEPEVLLMDEPFRGLDEPSARATLDLLRSYKHTGGILVISSHVKGSLEAICDEFIHFERQGGKTAVAV